jgi:hypothetical protein
VTLHWRLHICLWHRRIATFAHIPDGFGTVFLGLGIVNLVRSASVPPRSGRLRAREVFAASRKLRYDRSENVSVLSVEVRLLGHRLDLLLELGDSL